jgi:hypothetical protein
VRSKTVWMVVPVFIMLFVLTVSPSFCRPLAGGPAKGGFLLAGPDPAEPDAATDSAASRPVKTKNPTGALLRSLAVPGWGQLYDEQYIKSALVAAVEGLLVAGAIVEHQRSEDDYNIYQDTTRSDEVRQSSWLRYSRRTDKRNSYLWYLAGFKFLSMIDAYVDAHLYRFDEGPFAVEVQPGLESGLSMVVVKYEF